jgi:hypothetical protein
MSDHNRDYRDTRDTHPNIVKYHEQDFVSLG